MAMPYGLGEDPPVIMTRKQNANAASQTVDDWSIIPEPCKAPMVDNGDGNWTIPQLNGTCAIPIIYHGFVKHNANKDAIEALKKDDYPWQSPDIVWNSQAQMISEWYIEEIGNEGSVGNTTDFLKGIITREGWAKNNIPIRSIKSDTFEIPSDAETPTQSGGIGRQIDNFVNILQNLTDTANIVRGLAVVIGIGLCLYGAHKLA